VIAMTNWPQIFFETRIRWGASFVPNAPVQGSNVYPGIEILQNEGVSVGRGKGAAFEELVRSG